MVKKEENRVFLKIRNSRKVYIPFYAMIAILVGTTAYIKYIGRPIDHTAFLLTVGFSVFVLAITEIHRLGNSYEMNNNSITHKQGYFSISSKQLQFGAVSDCDVHQNFWQRIFSYGNVEVHLFSRENTTCIKNINRPYEFMELLQRKMRGFRGRSR